MRALDAMRRSVVTSLASEPILMRVASSSSAAIWRSMLARTPSLPLEVRLPALISTPLPPLPVPLAAALAGALAAALAAAAAAS